MKWNKKNLFNCLFFCSATAAAAAEEEEEEDGEGDGEIKGNNVQQILCSVW